MLLKNLLIRNFGSSVSFNGTSSKITIPITPSTDGLCIAFWLKNNSIVNSSQKFYVDWTSAADTNGFYIGSAGTAPYDRIRFCTFNGGSLTAQIFSKQINMFAQHHVVITIKANEAKLYIDGELQGTDTSCVFTSNANALTLGGKAYTASGYFIGLMSEFVMQNTTTPWTQAQIDDLMYKGIVPTGAKLYTLDSVATDQDGLNAATLSNITYVMETPTGMRFLQRGFTKSLYLASGTATNTVPIAPATTGFNLSFWVKNPLVSGSNNNFVWYGTSGQNGFKCYFHTSGSCFFQMWNNTAITVNKGFSFSDRHNRWWHITVSYAPGFFALYINGVLVASATTGVLMSVGTGATVLSFGNQSASQEIYFSEMILHNTPIPWTQKQVTEVFKQFKVPSGANGVYKLNNDILDSSGNGLDGTKSANCSYQVSVPFPVRSLV